MKAIVRRLARLEENFMPAIDPGTESWADILRRRRRRWARELGEPYVEKPYVSLVDERGRRPRTWAEILRERRAKWIDELRRSENDQNRTTADNSLPTDNGK